MKITGTVKEIFRCKDAVAPNDSRANILIEDQSGTHGWLSIDGRLDVDGSLLIGDTEPPTECLLVGSPVYLTTSES